MKMTGFNAYQLSTSVKDIGEGADRDDADTLSIGEGNCGMNLVRGIVIIIVVIIIIIIIRCSLYR